MEEVKLLNNKQSVTEFLKHNVVVILFVVLTLAGASVSGLQPHFLVNELRSEKFALDNAQHYVWVLAKPSKYDQHLVHKGALYYFYL